MHPLRVEADTGDEVLLACTVGCGRRLVLNRRTLGLTVLVRGDVWARHSGGTNGLEVVVGDGGG